VVRVTQCHRQCQHSIERMHATIYSSFIETVSILYRFRDMTSYLFLFYVCLAHPLEVTIEISPRSSAPKIKSLGGFVCVMICLMVFGLCLI